MRQNIAFRYGSFRCFLFFFFTASSRPRTVGAQMGRTKEDKAEESVCGGRERGEVTWTHLIS